ncbi:hypothetical protein [Moraxella lacunata]|uniref:hypothetical protein n=1 Tax=Moraxella lacunata TaxID=477 RepID=UPI003EE1C65F
MGHDDFSKSKKLIIPQSPYAYHSNIGRQFLPKMLQWYFYLDNWHEHFKIWQKIHPKQWHITAHGRFGECPKQRQACQYVRRWQPCQHRFGQ